MSFKPAINKAVERDRVEFSYECHRSKLASARASVDTRPPRTYMHQHLNMKKLQMEEERLANIERDNRKLLQRMSDIMRAPGRIDNRNDYAPRSMNRDNRRFETLSVVRENRHIHDRISSCKPDYDHREWEKDWKVNQKRMEQQSSFNKDNTEKMSPRRKSGQSAKKNKNSRSQATSSNNEEQKKKKKEKVKEENSSNYSSDNEDESQEDRSRNGKDVE